jgi:hypothetical protein
MNETIVVPDGWRMLTEGEVIYSGDRWLRPGADWQDVNSTGARWNPRGFWPCIRRVGKKDGAK